MQKFTSILLLAAAVAAADTTADQDSKLIAWINNGTAPNATGDFFTKQELGSVVGTNTTLGYSATFEVYWSETIKAGAMGMAWKVDSGSDAMWTTGSHMGLGFNLSFKVPAATNTTATASKASRLLATPSGDSAGYIWDVTLPADAASFKESSVKIVEWFSTGNKLPTTTPTYNSTAALAPANVTVNTDGKGWKFLPGSRNNFTPRAAGKGGVLNVVCGDVVDGADLDALFNDKVQA